MNEFSRKRLHNMTFWKGQSQGGGNRISGCQGLCAAGGQWAENRILEGCLAWTGLFPSLSNSDSPGVRWRLLGTFECL